MVIPSLVSDYLPAGIHDCTVEEISDAFGSNERRRDLVDKLTQYLERVRETGIPGHVIVDGSFVTAKDEPKDVDIVLVTDADISFLSSIVLSYNPIFSQEYVKETFKIHLFVAFENHPTSEHWIAFFSGVRGRSDTEKGLLRVEI